MLKRITALAVTCTLLFGISAIAAIPQKLNGINCEAELKLLDDFGFLPADFLDGFKPAKDIKRSDFAAILCNIMGYDKFGDVSSQSVSPFADVTEYHKDYLPILLADKFGIMTGDGSGNFRPDEPLTYIQAVKVIMSALGYDELAKAFGGYPAGYLTAVSKTDILDGVSISDYNDGIKSSDAITMLARALNTKVLEYSAIGDDSVQLSTDSDKTVLNICHGIYAYYGIVYGVPGKQAADVAPLEQYEILIGDNIYKIPAGKNFEKYFACSIKFYCHTDSKTVVAVDESESDNKVVTVNSDDIISFSDNIVTYFNGNKETSLRIDKATDIVYNGRLYSEFTPDDFLSSSTTVDFIDAGADGSIDVASITHCENYVVNKANASKETFYDIYSGKSFSTYGLDNVIFVDQLGNNMEFEELSQYDVISVVQSKDKRITSMIYSNRETEGTIDEISQSENKVVIDGITYAIADNFIPYSNELAPGKSGLFPMDTNGNIAAYKPYESAYTLGYLIDAYTSDGMNPSTYVRLLTCAGSIEVYKVADKFFADGDTQKGENALTFISENGSVKPQVIRYYISYGELKSIDTTASSGGGADDSLELMYQGVTDTTSTTLRYNKYQSVFGAKVPVSADTVVFAIPDNPEDEDSYGIYTQAEFSHDKTYTINAYSAKADGHIADALILFDAASKISSSTTFVVVESVSRFIDEDGEETAKLYVLCEGVQESYILKDISVLDNLKSISDTSKTHSLQCGDVLRLSLDADTGRVKKITLYYERANDYIYQNVNVGTNLTNSRRMMRANVYSLSDGIARLTQNSLSSANISLTIDEIESVNVPLFDVYRYSERNGKPEVSLSYISDIVDYRTSETDFSEVLVFSAYTNPGIILIYDK